MKKLRIVALIAFLSVFYLGCKEKKEEETSSFFPITSIIKGQINNIDTSLYSIIKVTYVDTSRSDTLYVKREDVRGLARDFLDIPELTKKKFTEENIPGPLEGQFTFTYRPIKPENEELKQIDLIVNQSPESETMGQVTSIFINRLLSTKDSAVTKKLLWQLDRSFQVTTSRQLPGQPEMYSSYKVIWNRDDQK